MTRMTRLTAGLLGYYAVSLILLRPDVLCNLPRSVLYKTSGTQAGGIMLRLPETNGTRSDCTIHRFLYNPIYRESPGPFGPGLSLVITDSKFIRTPSQSSQFSFLTLRLSVISLILSPFCCFAVHICSCFFFGKCCFPKPHCARSSAFCSQKIPAGFSPYTANCLFYSIFSQAGINIHLVDHDIQDLVIRSLHADFSDISHILDRLLDIFFHQALSGLKLTAAHTHVMAEERRMN